MQRDIDIMSVIDKSQKIIIASCIIVVFLIVIVTILCALFYRFLKYRSKNIDPSNRFNNTDESSLSSLKDVKASATHHTKEDAVIERMDIIKSFTINLSTICTDRSKNERNLILGQYACIPDIRRKFVMNEKCDGDILLGKGDEYICAIDGRSILKFWQDMEQRVECVSNELEANKEKSTKVSFKEEIYEVIAVSMMMIISLIHDESLEWLKKTSGIEDNSDFLQKSYCCNRFSIAGYDSNTTVMDSGNKVLLCNTEDDITYYANIHDYGDKFQDLVQFVKNNITACSTFVVNTNTVLNEERANVVIETGIQLGQNILLDHHIPDLQYTVKIDLDDKERKDILDANNMTEAENKLEEYLCSPAYYANKEIPLSYTIGFAQEFQEVINCSSQSSQYAKDNEGCQRSDLMC